MNQIDSLEHAKEFVNNIEKMRNPHIMDYPTFAEKNGIIEDYSIRQEKRDLENYRIFLNSFAGDDFLISKTKKKTLKN